VLVALDDPETTAAALAQLIADPRMRAEMGAAAHRHAVERFSMQRFVEGHVAALRSLAEHR
jgi:glycosyltransferase involved in cell wall biosynthesis